MRLVTLFASFLSMTSIVLADIDFIVPTTGTTFKVGDFITAVWKESGNHPRISELVQYDLFLCADGDIRGSYEELSTLMKDVPLARGNSVSFAIDFKVGSNNTNAYFLKMVASGSEASTISYSDRFTLTGMASSSSPHVNNWTASRLSQLDENPTPTDQEGPQIWKRRVVIDPYTIPYALQTGATRYAPMAKRPGTTIPTTSPVPQFTASLYTIATAYLPPATVVTTLTASDTFSIVGMENTAPPAPHPDEAQMKRLL